MKKRILSLLLAVSLILCGFAVSIPALADGEVTVAVSTDPTELLQAGPVNLTVVVTNGTSDQINDVSISGPNLGSTVLGNIAAGAQQPFSQAG